MRDAPASAPGPENLVFVYGALRSGTTVFRLMLDAHPAIANPGEKDFLFDHLIPDPTAPGGWRYDLGALREDRIFRTSKLEIDPAREGLGQLSGFLDQLRRRHPEQVLSINIHRNIDRLIAVLPDVRVIHMLRDPRDVARSSIAMGWAGTLYHGVGHWIATETAWDRVASRIAPERLLTLSYERLFEETEPVLREVCGFLGVDFDPAMLAYHENTTYAPPDPALVRQWRTKCDPRDIAHLESRAGAVMTRRGYPPETGLRAGPGPLTRARLTLADKSAVWRFGIRRFGAPLFLGEKLTRWTRWRSPHRAIRRRMNGIVQRHLK